MVQALSSGWYMILSILIGTYIILSYWKSIATWFKNIALTSKKSKYHKLRKSYWPTARLEIRKEVEEYCNTINGHYYNSVRCIMMYELDLKEYKETYILCGYDRLFLDVTTKLEEITRFVIDWKKANKTLDSTEMLSLYLNETKPENNDNRKSRHC